MKKKSLWMAMMAVAMCSMACEHISTIEKRIVNNSSRDVILVLESNLDGVIRDSMPVPAGTEGIVMIGEELGTSDAPPCLENITTVQILLPDSLSLIKSPVTEANWSNSTLKISRGEYKHICTFAFTDADIQ